VIVKRIAGRTSVASVAGSRGPTTVTRRSASQPVGPRPASAVTGEEAPAGVGAPLGGPISPIVEPQQFDPPGGPHG
jgi:hypothetical protein